ncbi:PRELI domain containing protein 3B [Lingula anatina]|uniref:PRELI domain containing protein 3B n=1 Tax=Lingula anatina TaxID=7574 RepID=A0A1S3J5H8_LINAN|nr:PRELI domain containing protein 3B [Lingula anatina]|eukprot:XP_013405677.1 PRELI domain containing protein 3B [Lingula anatina]
MKIWSSQHIFEHPWETVVTAAQRKYPNPINTNVTGLDVVNRHVDQQGVLQSHRLMRTKWGFPGWVIKLVGMSKDCFVSEHSKVDPANKTMVLKSQNMTYHNFVSVDETLVYTPHPEDKNKTILKQEAAITVHGVPLAGKLEGILEGNFDSNAHKGRQAIEWVISTIKVEAEEMTHAAKKGMERMEQAMHMKNTAVQDAL